MRLAWRAVPVLFSMVVGATVGCSDALPQESATSTVAVSPTATTVPRVPTTSTTLGGITLAAGEKAPGVALWSLVDGNDLDADRINLVFAPWGWDRQVAFAAFVEAALSWDGAAYLYDDDGQLTTSTADAVGAGLGLFAIEPWRSHRDQFNVWVTDVEPETPVAWINATEQPFAIADVSIVVVALDAFRFNPDLYSVSGHDVAFTGPDPPVRPSSGSPFANSVVTISRDYPAAGLVEVPHELGHGLFNLSDEYVGDQFGFDGRADLSSWPSCAEDKAEAAEWWGDLEGVVDPMVVTWGTELEAAGFPLVDPEAWADRVEVGAIDGGCYAVTGSYRATEDSLMNSSIPVLGAVNRRWAEQILDLWRGAPRP